MTNKKSEQILPIAELLPEGLSEAAIGEIANLVNTVITEQVEEKTRVLEAKVKGFLRLRVDELKEQALLELQQDEEFVRNANLFESIKTLMAVEMRQDDETNAISELMKEQTEFEEEVAILTEELRRSYEETEKLELLTKTLSTKVENLEEDNQLLIGAVETLEESTEAPFKSSEQAVIIAEDVDASVEPSKSEANSFLTPEVMKFMPQNLK
jgi:hypothetical protein